MTYASIQENGAKLQGNRVVAVSDMILTKNPEDVLITYALGSCLGVAIYDPVEKISGLLHCQLPLSTVSPEKAKANPFMYVDSGFAEMLNRAMQMGAKKSRVIIKVAGCSNILDQSGVFNIGQRNYTILRKLLWKNNLLIKAEHCGGVLSRTMLVEAATGRVFIRTQGEEFIL